MFGRLLDIILFRSTWRKVLFLAKYHMLIFSTAPDILGKLLLFVFLWRHWYANLATIVVKRPGRFQPLPVASVLPVFLGKSRRIILMFIGLIRLPTPVRVLPFPYKRYVNSINMRLFPLFSLRIKLGSSTALSF